MTIEVHNETDFEIETNRFVELVEHVLEFLHVHPGTEVSVLFVGEESMSGLHEQWLGEAGSTDVLSFPMDEMRPGRPDSLTPVGLLGDVVISPEVAALQAIAAGHSHEKEMYLLLTHGLLHLLGFDHATPNEEAEMFGLQGELLQGFSKKIGIE